MLIAVGGEEINVSLEGLTLRGARGVFGGAMHVSNRNTVSVDRCVFESNEASQAGGAIFVCQGDVRLVRSVFLHNRAGVGGALAAEMNASVSVDRCYFEGNEAKLGGAVDLEGEEIRSRIKSSTFIDNVASHPKGGGAVFVSGTATAGGPALEILNSLFAGDRPLVKNPERMGEIEMASSVVPPDTLSSLEYVDRGSNQELTSEFLERLDRFCVVSPDSPVAGLADLRHIEPDAADLLGRPLNRDGRADPGALARP
jgi:predicted outer membrane repeat protein